MTPFIYGLGVHRTYGSINKFRYESEYTITLEFGFGKPHYQIWPNGRLAVGRLYRLGGVCTVFSNGDATIIAEATDEADYGGTNNYIDSDDPEVVGMGVVNISRDGVRSTRCALMYYYISSMEHRTDGPSYYGILDDTLFSKYGMPQQPYITYASMYQRRGLPYGYLMWKETPW